jgi:ABC-2 type transport system permease protein
MSTSTRNYRHQIRALIIKELRQIMRDKQLIFLLFFMPVLQLFLYGFALSPDVEHLRLGVIDHAASPTSREAVAALVENGVFDLTASGGTEATLAKKVRDGDLEAGLIVPPEFEREIKHGTKVSMQVMLDGVDANTAGICQWLYQSDHFNFQQAACDQILMSW